MEIPWHHAEGRELRPAEVTSILMRGKGPRKKGSRAHIGEMKPYVRGRDVAVVDAYAAVMRVCGEGFQTCSLQHEHDVHPSGPGKMFLALEVAAAVAPLLGPAK